VLFSKREFHIETDAGIARTLKTQDFCFHVHNHP